MSEFLVIDCFFSCYVETIVTFYYLRVTVKT